MLKNYFVLLLGQLLNAHFEVLNHLEDKFYGYTHKTKLVYKVFLFVGAECHPVKDDFITESLSK